MDKEWWKSKSVWGGILLALEAALQSLNSSFGGPWLDAGLTATGTILVVVGLRAAIDAKK